MSAERVHERRVVGHASGWQEQMDTCVCGEKWPCSKAALSSNTLCVLIQEWATQIEAAYSHLPASYFPGPPTDLVDRMRAEAVRLLSSPHETPQSSSNERAAVACALKHADDAQDEGFDALALRVLAEEVRSVSPETLQPSSKTKLTLYGPDAMYEHESWEPIDLDGVYYRRSDVDAFLERLRGELDGYKDAYYQIAELLGMPAMPISPKEAFETVMLPRLRELLAPETPQPSSKTVNDLVAAMRAALKLRSGGEFRMTVAHATALLDEIERLSKVIDVAQHRGCTHFADINAGVPAVEKPQPSSKTEVHEWLRRLKVQAQQIALLNKSRDARGVSSKLMQITPEEMLSVIDLAFDGASPDETPAPQAPIAKLTVRENLNGTFVDAELYAPGLPPGEHDLYCEPEAVAPYMRAEKAGETPAPLWRLARNDPHFWDAPDHVYETHESPGGRIWARVRSDQERNELLRIEREHHPDLSSPEKASETTANPTHQHWALCATHIGGDCNCNAIPLKASEPWCDACMGAHVPGSIGGCVAEKTEVIHRPSCTYGMQVPGFPTVMDRECTCGALPRGESQS